MITTHTDIINMWPSHSDLADDIAIGCEAVRKWRERGRIPPEYWIDVYMSAKRRRYKGVTLKAMAQVAAKWRKNE